MKQLMRKIDPKILEQIVGKTNIRKIKDLLSDSNRTPDLAEITLAFFGESILDNSGIRIEAIKTAQSQILWDFGC